MTEEVARQRGELPFTFGKAPRFRVETCPANDDRPCVLGQHLLHRTYWRRSGPANLRAAVNPPREDKILSREGRAVVPGKVRLEAECGLHPTAREDPPALGVELRKRLRKLWDRLPAPIEVRELRVE